MRLTQFQERAASDLSDKLAEARELAGGEIAGLVLDLRDNPGGLLDQAVKVGDVWIDDGMIVFSEGRGGGNRMEWHAKKEGTEPEYPMIVLVNGGSASTSEIVSARCRTKRARARPADLRQGLRADHHPARGRFGPAPHHRALPAERTLDQEVRVQPDVLVEPYSEAELPRRSRPTKPRAIRWARSTSRPLRLADQAQGRARAGAARARARDRVGRARRGNARRQGSALQKQLDSDRQLTRAVELLKSWTVFSRLQTPASGTNVVTKKP